MYYSPDPTSENQAGWLRKVFAFIAGALAFPVGALLTATIGLALIALAWNTGRTLFYIVMEEVFGLDGLTGTVGSWVAAMAMLIGGPPGGILLANYVYGITIKTDKFERGAIQTAAALLVFPLGALLGIILGIYVQLSLYAAIRWMLSPGWLKGLFALDNWLEAVLVLSSVWVGGYLVGLMAVILTQGVIVQIRR